MLSKLSFHTSEKERSKFTLHVHHSPGLLGCLAVREVLALLEVPEKEKLF